MWHCFVGNKNDLAVLSAVSCKSDVIFLDFYMMATRTSLPGNITAPTPRLTQAQG